MSRPRRKHFNRPDPFRTEGLNKSSGRKRRTKPPYQSFSAPQNPMNDGDGRDGRTYYYVYVKPTKPEERPVFDGPHMTENEAYEYAYKNMPDKRFRVVPSPYRDPANATRALKHDRLTDEGIKLKEALMPVRHKI